ncbi:MAG: BolA family transcriptional regulator [Burkholderiales bacterium]|nr:BolA family transcriptional regulator [Burkholderiales bacterium]
MNVAEQIRGRLAKLQPVSLEIFDESHKHVGHAGAREGGHYHLRIVASAFAGAARVARHRMIYDALGDLMRGGVHALAIDAYAPDEVTK